MWEKFPAVTHDLELQTINILPADVYLVKVH